MYSGDEVYDDDVTSWLAACTCDHLHFPERGCVGCPSHSQEQWAKSLAGPYKVTFKDEDHAFGDKDDECTR